MSTTDTVPTAADVTRRVRAIAARLPDRATEIDAARRLPADILADLTAAGMFRLLLPGSHGGSEATFVEALSVYEMLATADPATGWSAMIGATGWCDLARLPRTTFDELFAPGSHTIIAGAFAPTGTLLPTDGGYELSGRWAFVSGCEHATHVFANAIEGFVDGHPSLRISVLDADEVEIEDTWNVIGLRGTGSHHVSANGVRVAADRTFVPLVGPPCVDTPIARIPTPAVFALAIASVAIGTARGAIDTAITVAHQRVPLLDRSPLATDMHFHHDLARADAALGAARSFVFEIATRLWDRAVVADPELTLEERARARAAAVWATDAAMATTEFCYRAGGGGAVYDGDPLQRRLRDVHAITQHFLVRPNTYVAAGGVLAGQELSVPVF
jgi:alkylation response protein AidB-like acyl-CoA dehydrogenase